MKQIFNFKNVLNFVLAALLLVVATSATTQNASANFQPASNNFDIQVNEGYSQLVSAEGVSEGLSDTGLYTVTYKFSEDAYRQSNAPKNATFPLQALLHNCPEGNGNDRNLYCWEANFTRQEVTINLNAGNNYTQTLTLNIQQEPNVPCGSFQTDLYAPNITTYDGDPNLRAASIYRTGRNMDTCPVASPSPSPSPSVAPSPSPSMSPSPSPSTIQCPTGKIQKVENSVIVCVAQDQNQNQTQTQNNDQNQNVNQIVNATGGSSSSSSSSSSNTNVTINNPATTNTVIKEVRVAATTTTPQVVTQTKGDVKELPKTGLPLAALALGGLMPAGFGLKKFGKKSNDEVSANSIWMERELNS